MKERNILRKDDRRHFAALPIPRRLEVGFDVAADGAKSVYIAKKCRVTDRCWCGNGIKSSVSFTYTCFDPFALVRYSNTVFACVVSEGRSVTRLEEGWALGSYG